MKRKQGLMLEYKLSEDAKEDLLRLYQFGVKKFGMNQADKYFDSFFKHFDLISLNPYSYEPVEHIRKGYRRCVVGSDSIYFRIEKEIVEIIAIVGRQDLNDKLNNF